MKIFPIHKYKQIDKLSIQKHPGGISAMMEKAGEVFYKWFKDKYPSENDIAVFCGTGNNGGDGLVFARKLAASAENCEVDIYIVTPEVSKKYSAVYQEKLENLKKEYIRPKYITEKDLEKEFPKLKENQIIVDCIFGTGLNRPLSEFYVSVVEKINASTNTIVSLDMPSGLFADRYTNTAAIKADFTFGFEMPKLAYLQKDAYESIGEWEVKELGFDKGIVDNTETFLYFTTQDDAKSIISKHPRKKHDHKGTFGHSLIVAGSHGSFGAAVLATKAAYHAGAGKVTCMSEESINPIIHTTVPEALVVNHYPKNLKEFSAIGIGPAIGATDQKLSLLLKIIAESEKPLVLDSDAITILSQNKHLLTALPKNSILTPHPREFTRLFGGKSYNSFERLKQQQELAVKYNIIIILKGAYTTICLPNGETHFNSSGSPALATAGTGDVLLGVITALLGQGFTETEASILGTYVHGRAGQLAGKKFGELSVTASNVIDSLPEGFI